MTLIGEIELPGVPKTVNATNRMHWTQRHKEAKRWKLAVFAECVRKKMTELNLSKARLELTRFSSREPDFDNLAHSFKHIIDGLRAAKVIIDDKPSVIGSPMFFWVKSSRKDAKIQIKIFSCETKALCSGR